MRAVTVVDGDLRRAEHPDPEPGDTGPVVAVRAAGTNAADLLQRRLRVNGSTLRTRPLVEKAVVVAAVESHVVPLLAAGRVRVPLAATVASERAADAYDRFARGARLGKIVLVSPG